MIRDYKKLIIDISDCNIAQVVKFMTEALHSLVYVEGKQQYLVPSESSCSKDYIWINIPTKYSVINTGYYCFADNAPSHIPLIKLKDIVSYVDGKYCIDYSQLNEDKNEF